MHRRTRLLLLLAGAFWARPLAGALVTDTIREFDREIQQHATNTLRLRNRIFSERMALGRRLAELQAEALAKRAHLERLREERSQVRTNVTLAKLAAGNLQRENDFLRAALNDYRNHLQATVHLLEIPQHEIMFAQAVESYRDAKLGRTEFYPRHVEILRAAVSRSRRMLAPRTFSGEVLLPEGMTAEGRIAIVGPVTVFAASNGSAAGTVRPKPGALKLQLFPLELEHADNIHGLVSTESGFLPLDLTGKYELNQRLHEETLLEHIRSGGPVMIVILGLGALAFSLGIFKLAQVSLVRIGQTEAMVSFPEYLRDSQRGQAAASAEIIRGWSGALLQKMARSIPGDSGSLRENADEVIATADWALRRGVSFIAVAASTAPLLGLLGTVTGMISTFRLISEHGAGNPAALSAGISESLITTEFGLIVAFPSIFLHTLITSRIKRVKQDLESLAQRVIVISLEPEREGPRQSVVPSVGLDHPTSAPAMI